MRRSVFVVTLFLMSIAMCAAKSDGFVSLFNGKNLDGWVVEGKPDGFEVRDGCIHSEGGKGGYCIWSAKPYANFVLRMDWMLSKTGNSGVFVRNPRSPANHLEVQLLAPWTPYRDDLHCTGSLYGHVPANPRPDETTLRWRKIEIRAAYRTVSVFIDGVKTAEGDYDRVPTLKGFPLAGHIGMQDSHTGAGEWVKFRNIEIKDLNQDPLFVMTGLTSGDAEVRSAASDAAVRLGPRMAGYLLPMLATAKPDKAHLYEIVITRIANSSTAPGGKVQAAEIQEMLVRRLSADAPADRSDKVLAANLLGTVGQGDSQTVHVLKLAILKGGRTGDVALGSMERIPGSAVTTGLVDLLSRVEASKKPAVALALGGRRDVSAFPALSGLVRSKDRDVRIAAIRALGVLGSAKAIPVLRKAAEVSSKNDRAVAVDALIMLSDSGGLTKDQQAEALETAKRFAVTDAQKAVR